MITVKQYAEERGVTIQAVHQSMSGKRKQAKLKGHVQVIDGVKWLDEEAVAILDEHRNKNPIVIVQQDMDETIERLRREKEVLLERVAAQGARIGELADWKAEKSLEIAAADQTKLLLEGTKAELEAAKRDAAEKAEELGFAQQEAEAAKKQAEEAKEAKERALAEKNAWAEYAAELEAYNALNRWKRRKAKKPQPPKED